MEGSMRGPSSQDCERSFARTGVPSANMLAKAKAQSKLAQTMPGQAISGQATLGQAMPRAAANLVQIRALPTMARATA